ncbi:MAG: Gfo/Idh/MocA family oxidoreductase [Chloroflexi bacterium]|nr:Gfo/Idh/MocA family oxidoreductase [Chloroflexota bacterium]
MKLGLCVLGCGSFAHTFSESLADARDGIDLYFASRDLGRAEAYSAEFNGAGAFGSYEEAVSDSRVDAVYICTPHDLHLEHAKLAAAAKKHILLEKPIARTVEEARQVISSTHEAGVTLMIAENYRFLTAVQEAKQIIESGVLGTIRLIQIQEEYPFEPGSWRNENGRNGGGVFIDGGIHKVSVLAYLSGRPAQVFAVTVPPGIPGLDAEDGMVVTTRSASGTVGVINHTWSVSKPTARPWVRVSGTLANLNFELGRAWLTIDDGQNQETRQLDDKIRGIAPMVREFTQSIIENREPSMTGEEGLEDLELVLKAYESAETGLPISLVSFHE